MPVQARVAILNAQFMLLSARLV